MDARFEASRAKALQQNSGDGNPIMLTIRRETGVPAGILGLLGLTATFVHADVFLIPRETEVARGRTGTHAQRAIDRRQSGS